MTTISDLFELSGIEVAEAAANLAVRFWLQDYDQRGVPFEEHPSPETVVFRPFSGTRLWIYCAELAWPKEEPEPQPRGGALAWCASVACPDGEIGMIHPDGRFHEITREKFLDAARNAWIPRIQDLPL